MNTLNMEEVTLYYLSRLLKSGDTMTECTHNVQCTHSVQGAKNMTLDQLQTDIKIINALLDAIKQFFPNNDTGNTIISFLETADNNPIVQNLILLVINTFATSKSPTSKLNA